MTLAIVAQDLQELPQNLLALAKQHLRVDHAGEDAFITSAIARAIGRFEQVNDVTLNPTEVVWEPNASAFVDGAATLPVRPAAIDEILNSDAVDVTADYSVVLKWDAIHGIPILTMRGAAVDGLSVTLTAGYTDLPPPVLDVVLRHTAHLFEHREILIPGREYVAPDLKLDATWWMPRA